MGDPADVRFVDPHAEGHRGHHNQPVFLLKAPLYLAPVIGGLVVGAWLVYSPLLLINEMWYSSYLIDPGSDITRAWKEKLRSPYDGER